MIAWNTYKWLVTVCLTIGYIWSCQEFGWFIWEFIVHKWFHWCPCIVNTRSILATIGWIRRYYWCRVGVSRVRHSTTCSLGGVSGCRVRVCSRSTWMRYHFGMLLLTGVNLIKNNLCLDSWICRWVRPEGETGISFIGRAEAFVAWHSYLIVGNRFVRGGGR